MKLLIVESPAKAKTISKYLDGAYEVKASVGHVRDLPKSNKKAIDIEAGFVPHYEISPGKEKVIAEIRKVVEGPGPDRILSQEMSSVETLLLSNSLRNAAETVTGPLN